MITVYTRITEFKYLTGQQSAKTSIVYEYPRETGDPYYPIPRPENAAIYARYRELAVKDDRVHFCGRLANYKYFNMDQVVAQALATFRRIAEQNGEQRRFKRRLGAHAKGHMERTARCRRRCRMRRRPSDISRRRPGSEERTRGR